jgi:flagellar basal body rod protein FlgC
VSFDLLDASAAGMSAQRSALDVAARNMAAAQAAGPKGSYTRLEPVFRVVRSDDGSDERVEFAGTRADRATDGDALEEMLAAMNASRAYEADASLFDVGKRLAQQTIDMGRL